KPKHQNGNMKEYGIGAQILKILANPVSHPTELVMPGHIFPLIAKEGGTLVRIGHTEGSVDLCRLFGLAESAVICEIMKEDGSMARRDDLDIFAQKHSLKTVYISDIVEYRLANEILVKAISEEEIEFFGVHVKKYSFEDHQGDQHTAVVFYKAGETANVRVHNVIPDIDLLLNQSRYTQLIDSIHYLKQNSGVLLFINKPKHQNGNMKEYGIGAQILKILGVRHMRLIADSKNVEFAALSGFGLDVIEVINPCEGIE
ncbi:MAG TPA: 3,4-dihydroxy-2-butanone-4-phosphate synthase, partial [Sulfuricurvum sp.]|nr:3,4-dihydroxy-2-butanone-4-phosphate synthase [Sulfuricurvum sp.]